MIGIMLLFALSAGVLVSGVMGLIVLMPLLQAFSAGTRWPLTIAVLVTVAGIVIAASLLSGLRGAMSAEDFRRVLVAPLVLGAAPGIGMLVGRLMLFLR